MSKRVILFLAVICGLCTAPSLALGNTTGPQPPQSVNSTAPLLSNNAPPVLDNSLRAGSASLMSSREFWLSVIILTFGIIIVIIEFFLLKGMVKDKTEEIARIYTVTLIIIGTLVLISSGFTNEQIAPALGLFGTIAGYLLGRSDFRVTQREKRDDKAD